MSDELKTTPTTLAEQDERLQLIRLADAQQRFIKMWQPEDRRNRDEFARDLYYLIHMTYREAQAPITKQLSEWALRYPFTAERMMRKS